MQTRNYKMLTVHHLCSICPSEYWNQLLNNSKERYDKSNKIK
jgi:hypothetical protein